jgi:twitching motility protein PilT
MRIPSRRLGELLVERRVVSRDTVDELLAREASSGPPLAELLVSERVVSEHDLVAAVAAELGVRFVDLTDRSILPDVWAMVPEDLARGYLAVAVERERGGVLVALEDPADEQVVAALTADLGVTVIPAAAVRAELVAAVEEMYGAAGEPATGGDWADSSMADPAAPPSVRTARVELDALLDEVVRIGGSDLHLTVGSPPVVRVQGQLRRLPNTPSLNGSEVRRLVFGVLTERQREAFLAQGELSTSHAIPGRGRFRVSAFVQRDSVGAVLRLVPGEIPTAEDLGLPDNVIEWVDQRDGLVLVCGSHRSGTSTTMAALVDHINRTRAAHILTVEQPIEFLHRHRSSLVNQREVGEDTASFATGLRYAMRQDPDVIVSGELPDTESIRLALGAAETGHLVIAGLRTVDAVQTIDRIADVFPIDQQQQIRVQLGATLRGVIVQQLVPALDEGLAIATEVMTPTSVVVECIRTGDSPGMRKALLSGIGSGMSTMDQSLSELVKEAIVDSEVAIDRAADPGELRYLLSGQGR